ncbi:Erv1 / Alr family protein [Dictyocaulus viviparus]|uniref:Sulfhydryl oxidase n=1 Tax=Dictyocaulus viviparus TaxID=29172 RepID=A0A0D8XVB3_DICVI|nr:Erv1 / Alr family protein [Dictyocaulus viviparus]
MKPAKLLQRFAFQYFPRTARAPNQAQKLDTQHSAEAIREAVMRMVSNEYAIARYPDWPNFSHIVVNSQSTYGHLWDGVPDSADYLAIIFEQYDGVGVQFILDLLSRSRVLGARRALSNSPLVQMLRIVQFPTVALFKRDHQHALYMQPFTISTYSDLDNVILNDSHNSRPLINLLTTTRRPIITTTTIPIVDCQRNPYKCRDLYFVSETDMLKAMRMALYDEVTRTPGDIRGENFTALTNFVTLLSEHFPILTFSNDIRRSRGVSVILKNSDRARLIFIHMREFLKSRRNLNTIAVDEYKRQFENVERVYAYPFPVSSQWQHCKGTTPMFRGYTCGLWTTFHALTVHTYIDTIRDNTMDPLKPLKAIQGWVQSFFGCQHCKRHFMAMTTRIFPMNERRVRHPHDMMMYLWRAHNIVNNRLHGDPTEDPQFTKMQFPPPFLCPTCSAGGQFSRRQVSISLAFSS